MIDPRRLLTFREVARQQSFSRAAVAQSLTQPAVSQQIRALEVGLGERLIERGRGGLALTAAGELLLGHAEVLHARLHLAETQLGRRARLAESAGFESVWVGDHISLPMGAQAVAAYPPEQPRLEAMTALSYLTGITSRVRLGVGVIVMPQRHPLLLAKQQRWPDVSHPQ